jgi:hypothetical protein
MDEEPVVGAVYEDTDGRTFEVSSFDENEAMVKLRFEDGSTEDIDLDAWYEMDLTQLSAPEDEEEDEDLEVEEEEEDFDEDEDEDLDEDEEYEE